MSQPTPNDRVDDVTVAEETTSSESRTSRRALLIEGAVIVASILLAFAIDRGYEQFQEGAEESVILDGLRADFLASQSALEAHLDWHDRWRDAVEVALVYGAAPAGEQADDRVEFAFAQFYANPSPDPNTATLDLVESSGRGRVLTDRELRRLVAEWRVHTDDAIDQQAGLQRNRDLMVWPALTALDFRSPDGVRYAIDPGGGTPTPDELREARLPAILDLHSSLLRRTRVDWEEVLEATNRVLERLEQLGAR